MATITTTGPKLPDLTETPLSHEKLSENVKVTRYTYGDQYDVLVGRNTIVSEVWNCLDDIPGPEADQIRRGVLTDSLDPLSDPVLGISDNQILMCVWYQK